MKRKNRMNLRADDQEWERIERAMDAADANNPLRVSRATWLRLVALEGAAYFEGEGKQLWEADLKKKAQGK